jgi:hypothetical protein
MKKEKLTIEQALAKVEKERREAYVSALKEAADKGAAMAMEVINANIERP